MSRRLSTARLLELGESLSDAERAVLHDVAQLRLLSHAQLALRLDLTCKERSAASAARETRRVLARLTSDGLLARLNRRVGGIRAGSAGYVYYLGPHGQRLLAYWEGRGLSRGRLRPEPGGRYMRHRLAVSELYVQLQRAVDTNRLAHLRFDVEPSCWRDYVDDLGGRTTLKPDAAVTLQLGEFEDSWFVEVDLATESRTVIARKLRTYLSYFNTGAEQDDHGVFPRVLFATTTEARRSQIVELCVALPAESWRLFAVTTLDRAIDAFISGGYGAELTPQRHRP